MSYLCLQGGRVVDPTNEVDRVADVWIHDGKIIAQPSAEDQQSIGVRRIDVRGEVVMAGAIDMHCHIAGSKVNAARMMMPHLNRRSIEASRKFHRHWFHSGSAGAVPSLFTTGYKYTCLLYTSDAADE